MRYMPNLAVTLMMFLVLGVSAQSAQYPDELEGYRFFASGKLKGLQLLASTRENVKSVFGEACAERCDYDQDWEIEFEYFDAIWVRESSNNKGARVSYSLDPKYLGTLRTVILRPKRSVPFTQVSFPNAFERLIVTSTTDTAGNKSRMTVHNAFQDRYGLTYEIYDTTNYDDIKAKQAKHYDRGELVLIRYNVPKDREKRLFIPQK